MRQIRTAEAAGAYVPTLILFTAVLTASPTSAQITVGSLADELADRDALSIFPTASAGYSLQQSSSHDQRNGVANTTSSLSRPWGGLNADFSNWLRFETNQGRQELVAFEDVGPGAITRWWTTALNAGLLDNNIRIYLADSQGNFSESANVTISANDFVGRNGQGNTLGFGDSFDFITPNVGGNSYGPITYQHGVKVTWDGPSNHRRNGVDYASLLDQQLATGSGSFDQFQGTSTWYNINYRKYAPGTVVEDFTTSATTTYSSELSTANTRLGSTTVHGHVGATDTIAGQSLANGATLSRSYTAPAGPSDGQAIREVTLKFNGGSSSQLRGALEGTLVELTFDGQVTARVPAGQFFGNGWSENSSNVLNEGSDYFRTVAGDGTLTSRWVMPYQNDAEIRLINNSGQVLNVDFEVKTGDYQWTSDSLHFHADYRESEGIKTRAITSGGNFDGAGQADANFRFINVRGRGVFVGDTLSVRNRDVGGGGNPDGWWGEGDEKIFVDYLDANGDGSSATPVHLGTGAEDYYGYSFGSGSQFGSPFVTQPIATGQRNNPNGLTVNGRVRGLDAIPFNESLKFDLEVWKWREGEVDHGAATFWYGEPGAVSLEEVANLAADFQTATNGTLGENIPDTSGTGQWDYLKSDNANPSANGADLQTLVWGDIGNDGAQGYGGGEIGAWNVAAISDQYIFLDGDDNLGVQGAPGYNELALHPGGETTDYDYMVARWTAGSAADGLVNIEGSIRNFINNSDSVEFFIYVDGMLEFSAAAAGATLEETYFDFDSTVSPGQTVDFVLGNGGADNPFGDESILRAIISSDFLAPVELLGDLDGDGSIGVGDWQILRDNLYTPVGDLNDDGINDIVDFGIFKQVYLATNGPGSFSSLLAVPEPQSVGTIGILVGMLAARRYGQRSSARRDGR